MFAGDAVVVVFSARALPLDGGDPKLRRMGETFDPFVVGGAGASVSKGFKLEVGASTGDIVEGWERAFEGDGRAPRMKIGGRRAVRIPPNLAYGDRGHHWARQVGHHVFCRRPRGVGGGQPVAAHHARRRVAARP